MDDYPYANLGADGWLCCDGLHRPSFLTLLWDMLHHFGHTGTPTYRGRTHHEFGCGRCEIHVDIPAHPSDLGMTAWFTMATGDNLNDTPERAAHLALTEFYERHLADLVGTAIALFPVLNEGSTVWSERLAVVDDPERLAYHAGGRLRHTTPST
jgi:hypothetical protein